MKGHIVFKGYFKNPEQTKEVLDDEGWLHTGDIGRWLPEGTLKIVDRKKHIFKLSQGEYVAPEKIENVYSRSQFVAQSFVYGESLKTCLIGIVVPDVEVLAPYCKKEMGLEGDMVNLCSNPEVKKLILDDMVSVGKQAGLHSFEQVGSFNRTVSLCLGLYISSNVYFPGERHLPLPGAVLHRERSPDANPEEQEAATEDSLCHSIIRNVF